MVSIADPSGGRSSREEPHEPGLPRPTLRFRLHAWREFRRALDHSHRPHGCASRHRGDNDRTEAKTPSARPFLNRRGSVCGAAHGGSSGMPTADVTYDARRDIPCVAAGVCFTSYTAVTGGSGWAVLRRTG